MEYVVKLGAKMIAETVFTRITAPLQTLLKKETDQLHGDSLLYYAIAVFFRDKSGLRPHQKNRLH